MRLRLMAAAAAVLLFAGLAPAQSYFVPYSTGVGGQAGQLLGTGDYLFHPAVKVGGVVTALPDAGEGWYGFAYCLSAGATTAGGYVYSPTGQRLAAVWEKVDGVWVLDRAADLTAGRYFFSYPWAALDDGTVVMAGYTYAGRVEYFAW